MYNAAMEPCKDDIKASALTAGSQKNEADNGTLTSGADSCFWETVTPTNLLCGTSAPIKSCGGKVGVICVGVMVCPKQFEHKGTTLKPGVYSVACAPESGSCSNLLRSSCAADKVASTDTPYTIIEVRDNGIIGIKGQTGAEK